MNRSDFIFSENRSYRLRRHLLFWLVWWLYFSASYYHYEQSGLKQIEFEPWNFPFLIKSMFLLSLHVVVCYFFTDYLMPRLLLKRRYKSLITVLFLLALVILFASYLLHRTIFPLVDGAFNYHGKLTAQNVWWTSICSGLLSAPKVICAAAAIKLLKRWWINQKEKEKLEQEKLVAQLQLLKAQIHPELVFSSLNQISDLTQKKESKKASVLLLKLADILSYMLYECDNGMVPLEKEIKTIKDYLFLGKTRMGDKLETDLAVKGDATNKMIAPLLLFSFVENRFAFFNYRRPEPNWINLEFLIGTNDVTMKLIHGKNIHQPMEVENGHNDNTIIKWLDFFYEDAYELKTTDEPDIMMTSLNIRLEQPSNQKHERLFSKHLTYATS